MMKRILAAVLSLVMVAVVLPLAALIPQKTEAGPYVMPSHNGKTNNVTYTLGAGTDAETPVKVDFRTSLSSKSFNLKYIMIHNTGTYVSTATAKNVHTNTNKTSTSAAWHYTVDDKEIYQGVPDNRYAGHAGTSRTTTPSSYNAIGIEMCVNNFPATETFGGEKWSDGDAIMKWYEDQFDQTMKNTAYLVAVLCERHGLDYRTAVKMHYDALQYDPSTNYGKDCPMQMRATYNESTNTFKKAGYYTNGRDGYFWKIFWSYLEQYAAGAKEVTSPYAPGNTITFESNGGSAVTPAKVKTGDTVPVPTPPARYAFDFAGWYCNPELTDLYDFNTPVPYDFTLYAKWVEQYWGANNNLMPNEQQLQLVDFEEKGQIWPYYNADEYGSVTMYNGVTNDTNWSWPTAYMTYQNSFDSVNDTYIYLKKDGTAQFNVVVTYLDKDGVEHSLHLSTVAGQGETDLPAGPMEEFFNIGSYIRNVGHAPASGNVKFTQVNYYVVGEKDSYVKLYDLRFTQKFDLPDKHKTMMNDNITQLSGAGNYTYNDGTLTMNATAASGYSIKMDVNDTFDPTVMKNLLMDVDSTAPFNVSMELTNANGDANMEFKNEFFNVFELTGEFNALPAGAWNVNMYLLGYYEWNGGMINNSNVKSVTITLTQPGTLTLKALQASAVTDIVYVKDGGSSNGNLSEKPAQPNGDVTGDGKVTTTDARSIVSHIVDLEKLTDEMLSFADYDSDGKISTADVREILAAIVV